MRKLKGKKNKFSYLFWGLFCAQVFCVFWPCCICVIKDGAGILHEAAVWGAALLILLLTVRIFLTLRKCFLKRQKEMTGKREARFQKTSRVLACFLFLFLVGLCAWHGSRAGDGMIQEGSLYQMAKVSGENSLHVSFPALSSLYVGLLHTVFLFLGNKLEWIGVTQAALSVLAGLIFYQVAGRLAGRGSALLFFALWGLWPGNAWGFKEAAPDFLLCIAVGIGLLVMLFWYERICGKKKSALFWGALSGFVAGFVLWTDVFGIFLAIAGVVGLIQLKTERRGWGKINNALCFLLGFGICTVLLFWREAALNPGTVRTLLGEWCREYLDSISLQIPVYAPEPESGFVLGCCVLGGFGLCAFWVKDWDNLPVLAVLSVGLFLVGGNGKTAGHYSGLAGFIWLMTGCVGVQYFMDLYYGKEMVMEGVKMPEIKTGQKEKNGVALIPNPLPGPKKHVKRQLDFVIEPEEDSMKFDLELTAGNDDFDI